MPGRRIQLPVRVEEFFREHPIGRRRLLALTYEFDPAAFERAFATVLRRPIQVDVIAGKECEGSTMRARFWRANWPGTFHPKMICLLADDQVCVGLGSANLTSSGMGENLEAWGWFDLDEDRVMLGGIRDFLKGLQDQNVFSRKAMVGEFIEALPEASSQQGVLSTLQGPLLDQVLHRLDKPVQKVDIVTPINGDPSALVRQIVAASGTQAISLYTGEQPVPLVSGVKAYYRLERPGEDESDEGLRAVSLAHAKLYAFYHRQRVDLFWGSANLSYSAWMARGKRANVEILVHTRMKAREWIFLRDRTLPPGHHWVPDTPERRFQPEPIERPCASWRLLHAVLDQGRLWLEASASRKVTVEIRTENSRRTVRCSLVFKDAEAVIPRTCARHLDCDGDHTPRSLLWRSNKAAVWCRIPVNRLDVIGESTESADLAQQLFWEYCGRRLPRQDAALGLTPASDLGEDGDLPDDERELTLCDHQGELDRFVLEWRLIARRAALAAGLNSALRRFHINAILVRIEEASRESPERWPPYRIEFVRQLLERKWQK